MGFGGVLLEGKGGRKTDMKSDANNLSVSSSGAPAFNYWIDNINICGKRYPYLNIHAFQVKDNTKIIPVNSKVGLPTFKYNIGNGKSKYFHSKFDPQKEAEKWAEASCFDSGSIIVVLGAGFFYHIAEIIKRIPAHQSIVIIERDEEIFREAVKAIELKDILNRDGLHLFVGRQADEAITFITKVEINNSFKKVDFLTHNPSVQAFPEFYNAIVHKFITSRSLNLYDRLRYKKFCQEDAKVFLLTTQYFLMGEIISALERMSIDYRLVRIENDEMGCQEFIEEIIKNILDFKPDFLFTINHLGMDREGALAQFLSKIEMPIASWYVDNPNLIIKHYRNNLTPYCALFLWDKNNITDMEALGFEHVFYLPLGVDERRFCPIDNQRNPMASNASPVAFVGNSMVQKARDRIKKTNVNGELKSFFKKIANEYARSAERHVDQTIKLQYPELYSQFCNLPDDQKANYETAVSWESTKIYRWERVKKLSPFRPLIVGDPYWYELIDDHRFRHHRELSYYDELPQLYNVTAVNFNATSRQMKGAVNQRVFDVPACNSFLITDYQEQMDELFDIGDEVVCYSEPDEIDDLVGYYLNHETERKQIALRGSQRVVRDHTYVSRVNELIKTMKRIFL